jgi:amidophosphoribosyltransferase
MSDGLRHECGVFAVVLSESGRDSVDLPSTIYTGLLALQHRGQESAGLAVSDGTKICCHKGLGLVTNAFQKRELQELLEIGPTLGIGHTRYSTMGTSELRNSQPLVVDTVHGSLGIAHNGELVNAKSLRQKLMKGGVGLSTKTDSELITQCLSMAPVEGEPNGADWPARIRGFMKMSETAYSMVIMTGTSVYAVRDPVGNRPLCLGKLLPFSACSTSGSPLVKRSRLSSVSGDCSDSGFSSDSCPTESLTPGWVVSSESCPFYSTGTELCREVLPGEIIEVTRQGFKSCGIVQRNPESLNPSLCIFEYVYFARADSVLEGQMVYNVRKQCGKQLAIEAPVEAELVSTVPESATPAAMGYAEQIGIPYVEVLTKSRYAGRTFIHPDDRTRQMGVLHKFGPLTENFRDKRVVLIDDSIVRGNTIRPIVSLLKSQGAKEVHVRVASPPLKYPCYMGINIPTRDELIANHMGASDLGRHLEADSLVYLSHDGLINAVQKGIHKDRPGGVGHCSACLTGKYPVELEW